MLITLAHWQLTTRCQMVLGKTNSKHLIHKNNLWSLTFNNQQMFILCPCVLCSKSEIPSQGISSFSSPHVPLYFMLIAKQKICYYSHEISQFSNLFWPKLFQSHFYKTLRRHLFLPITNNWTHTCGFYSESSRPDAFWVGINFMWLDIIFECGILN